MTDAGDAAGGVGTAGVGTVTRTWRDWRWLGGLAVLAFLVRLIPLLIGGGLGFIGRYDDGVYYAASDALTFGRLPYKHFLLLHPPGMMLVLLPFAVLGRLTTDMTGMETARIAFMLIGSANTVLVALLARRWGRLSMIVAGTLYACWLPAVYTEQTTFLEPVGGLLVLIALYQLVNTERSTLVRSDLIAGLCLGFATTVKIWYVAPWATIVVWRLIARQPRSALRVIASGVAVVAAVVVPFAALTGHRMEEMVIRDQLFRHNAVNSHLWRLLGMVGVRGFMDDRSLAVKAISALLAIALLLVAANALWDRAARPLIAVLAVNVVVLVASPVFLDHYGEYITGPLAVLVGVGMARLFARGLPPLVPQTALVGLLAVCVVSGIVVAVTKQGRAFPGPAFAAVAPKGCIAADDPLAIAEVNRLSRDFSEGCDVYIDVSGALIDKFNEVLPNGKLVPKRENRGWQRYLLHYLTSAQGFILSRPLSDGIFGEVAAAYDPYPLLAASSDGQDYLRLGAGYGPPAVSQPRTRFGRRGRPGELSARPGHHP